MNPPSFKVPVEALALVPIASTDPERKNLHWLQLKPMSGQHGLVATATDGHMLGQVSWETKERVLSGPIHLRASQLKKKMRSVGKNGWSKGATFHITDKRIQFHTGEPEPIDTEEDSVSFPDTAQVMPPDHLEVCTYKPEFNGVALGLDLAFIDTVHTWMKDIRRGHFRTKLLIPGPFDPVRIDLSDMQDPKTMSLNELKIAYWNAKTLSWSYRYGNPTNLEHPLVKLYEELRQELNERTRSKK